MNLLKLACALLVLGVVAGAVLFLRGSDDRAQEPAPALTLPQSPPSDPHAMHAGMTEVQRYSRNKTSYEIPDVALLDRHGKGVALRSLFAEERPVMLQFIFTTCSTICPVLSSTFSGVQEQYGAELDRLRMVSISIDPEHDTPERLDEYAERLDAEARWHFLTGGLADIVTVLKAFDAYQGNKMNHEPLTFLRASPTSSWIRLNGLMSAADLMAEYRAALADASGDAKVGRRIYEEGVLPSGEILKARVQGDIPFDSALFSCSSCHRRSGYGSSEGGTFVPPIAGPALFRMGAWRGQDLMRNVYREEQPDRFKRRVREMTTRPAYTDDTLLRALREGVGNTGRELDPTMPRYELSDTDAGYLIAYLRTLSNESAPGVDGSRIHFATVVTDAGDAGERAAMLSVLSGFFRKQNTETRNEWKHRGHSPVFKDYYLPTYREWVLHEWELRGPPDNWPEQLDAYYRETPVFAMVAGIGVEPWGPVHDFSEREKVPCVFPNTARPTVGADNVYTFYFSGGVILEARALARYLRETEVPGDPARLVQVYRRDTAVAASTLANALGEMGMEAPIDLLIDGEPTVAFVLEALERHSPTALVLWLDGLKLDSLRTAFDASPGLERIYLSSSLIGESPSVPDALEDRVRLLYPFALRAELGPRIFEDRSWFQGRGITVTHERLQLNTLFAATITRNALHHIMDTFSREYFIESIEHDAEEALTFGAYGRLSLGRDQRFGSKGCYIVRLTKETVEGIEPLSEWIVP